MRVCPVLGVTLAASMSMGCAARAYETRGAYAPADAAKMLERRGASATIVRGEQRTELPPGARIEGSGSQLHVTLPEGARGGTVYELEDGDAIVVDEQDRIVAIKRKSGAEMRFAPGTATQAPGSDEILVAQSREMPLEPGDRVEVVTRYGPGDVLPSGRVVVERPRVMMIVGGSLLALAGYAPAFGVGVTSSLKQDRILVLPLLGPWIDLFARPACVAPKTDLVGIDPCTPETAIKVGLVASGITQAVGAVLIGFGLSPEIAVVDEKDAQLRIGPFGAHGSF